MANNRMAIVCKDCNLGIAIAKFYPHGGFIAGDGSGWGQYPLNKEGVNDFFVKHAHAHDQSMWGGNQYDLRYEIDDDTWKYDEVVPTSGEHRMTLSKEALEPAENITISNEGLQL